MSKKMKRFFIPFLTERALSMQLNQREFVGSTLGVMDPYILEELDPMTLDFKMWDDISGLVPNGLPGTQGLNIFDFVDPLKIAFSYQSDFRVKFDLGADFMDSLSVSLQKLFMLIRNTDNTRLLELALDTMPEINGVSLVLSNGCNSLASCIDLYSKPEFGAIQTSIVNAGMDITPTPNPVEKWLRVEGKIPMSSDTEISVTAITKRLNGLHNRRFASLGDLDGYTWDGLDELFLDIWYLDKVPAIVIHEAES